MILLAIDLGGARVGHATFRTGQDVTEQHQLVTVGTWLIQDSRRKESPGVRWLRLRQQLERLLANPHLEAGPRPDLVVYEEVRAHVSRGPEKLSADGLRVQQIARRLRDRCGHLPPGDRRLIEDAIAELERFAVTLQPPPRMNVDAAHAYGAGEGILLAWCAERGIPVKSQPIGTIKAAATGRGGGAGTDKGAVLEAARRRWPGFEFPDDNASDAAFIGRAALIELGLATATPRPPKAPAAAGTPQPAPPAPRNLFEQPEET